MVNWSQVCQTKEGLKELNPRKYLVKMGLWEIGSYLNLEGKLKPRKQKGTRLKTQLKPSKSNKVPNNNYPNFLPRII